jgi:hypothetical protein
MPERDVMHGGRLLPWAALVGIDDMSCPAATFCAAQGTLDYGGQRRALSQTWS